MVCERYFGGSLSNWFDRFLVVTRIWSRDFDGCLCYRFERFLNVPRILSRDTNNGLVLQVRRIYLYHGFRDLRAMDGREADGERFESCAERLIGERQAD